MSFGAIHENLIEDETIDPYCRRQRCSYDSSYILYICNSECIMY